MPHVRRRDGLDALVQKPLRGENVVSHGAGQHDLAQGVQARHVRRGVGLGVAQPLGIRQGLGIVQPQALHGVQHIVGGAVQDAAQREDAVALPCQGQIVQEGDPAAAGGAEQKGDALLPRQAVELHALCRDQRLVGGDKVLARLHRLAGVGEGRFDPTHDLRHRLHRGVVHDGLHAADFVGRVLLARPDQDRARLQAAGFAEHLVHAHAHRAETQDRCFHNCLRKKNGSARKRHLCAVSRELFPGDTANFN